MKYVGDDSRGMSPGFSLANRSINKGLSLTRSMGMLPNISRINFGATKKKKVGLHLVKELMIILGIWYDEDDEIRDKWSLNEEGDTNEIWHAASKGKGIERIIYKIKVG